MTRSPDRYTRIAVALHWTIALAILFQIILGWRMDDHSNSAVTFQVFQLHKSIGITVLLLSLVRLGWRIANPPPPLPDHLKRWERTLAHLTHFAFYAIMIGLPVTGWIMVSASKTNIPTLLFGVIPWPHVPGVAELAPQAKLLWHKGGEIGHGALAKLTYLLLALHVGGALKHQLVDRDETLARMIPGVRGGAWLDPRAVVAALAVVGTLAAGQLVFRGTSTPSTASPPPIATPATPPPLPARETPAPAMPAEQLPARPLQPVSRWTVEPGGKLDFATSWSGQAVTGQFREWSADVRFSEDAPQDSSVTVTINPASVVTGDAQRDATLPTDDWFDTARFAKATFHAGSFRKSGKTYVADGRMTLKGVSHPLKLTFILDIKGDRATAQGEASLDRTAFGIGKGEFAATDQIPATVQVRFSLTAHREPGKTGKAPAS